MPPSLRLALNNLSGRWGRTAMIVGAVAIAAGLIAAVSCAISSVQESMELRIAQVLGRADARIIHQFGGRFDEAIIETARQWPEVEHVTGRLFDSLSLVHVDRRADPETGRTLRSMATAIGVEFAHEAHFTQLDIVAGRAPAAPHEMLLDVTASEDLRAGVGDWLIAEGSPGGMEFTVIGLYARDSMMGAPRAARRPQVRLDRRALAEAVGHPGQMTSAVMILGSDRELPAPANDASRADRVRAFCEQYASEIPPVLALEPAEMVRSGFDRRIEAGRFGVAITTVLAFMSAAFIIVTAMTTSVIERQREMALARSIGATRAQLFAAQLASGSVVGVIGAALGIPLGVGLTSALIWWFQDALPAGLALHGPGLAMAAAGSLAAGLAGAIYPAWLAASVTPLEAMARRARPPRAIGLVVATSLGLALIAVQLSLLLPEDSNTRFYGYMTAGLPLVHIGAFILAVPMLMLIALLVSGPLSALLRLPAGVLGRSVTATPYRNGFTAGALMVGVSLLVSTWGAGQGLLSDWVGQMKFPDGFAYRRAGITPAQQEAIVNLPFVRSAAPMTYLPVRVIGRQVFGIEGMSPPNVLCIGLDPRKFFLEGGGAIEWIQGDPRYAVARLREGDAIIVADRFLIAGSIGVGERLTLGPHGSGTRPNGNAGGEFEVVGVVSTGGLDIASQIFGVRSAYMEFSVSNVFMDIDAMRRHFDNHETYMMQLDLHPNAGADEDVQEAIAAVAPGVSFRSGRWILEMIGEVARTVLTVQSTIAFAALVLACIGAGNVIMANIHGRRYEYGVLRAAGAQRGLLLRLVFGEALILALTGAAVGTLLGIHLAWMSTMFYRDLAGIDVGLAVPMLPIALGWGLLAVLTLIAALPGALGIMRRTPSELLAVGRNG